MNWGCLAVWLGLMLAAALALIGAQWLVWWLAGVAYG
jgi:hypothetical protein